MRRKHDADNYADAIARLQNASEEEQDRIIRAMTPHDALMFDADFEAWAHAAQLPPKDEGWRTWLMMAGLTLVVIVLGLLSRLLAYLAH